MRFIYTLLLSLGFVAATFSSQATVATAKAVKANQYSTAQAPTPDEALHDYCTASSVQGISNHALPKDGAEAFTTVIFCRASAYVCNDNFKRLLSDLSGHNAISFKSKLIFPQHYYW